MAVKHRIRVYANEADIATADVLAMIPDGVKAELEAIDPQWVDGVRPYVVAHEGESRPKVQDEKTGDWKNEVITWTKNAVAKVVDAIAPGVPFKKGHIYQGEDKREDLARVIGKGLKEISGKQSAIAVAYVPKENRALVDQWKNVSMEAVWDLSKGAFGFIADSIDDLKAFALGNEKPAFASAGVLAHAFEEDEIDKKNRRGERMTFEEWIAAGKAFNAHVWQLFTLEDVQNDRQIGPAIDKLIGEKVKAAEAVKDEQLKRVNDELAAVKSAQTGKTLSDKLQALMIESKVTEAGAKYAKKLFDPSKLGQVDVSNEGAVRGALEKFLTDAQKDAQELGITFHAAGEGAAKPPAGNPGPKSGDIVDASRPENNPGLEAF